MTDATLSIGLANFGSYFGPDWSRLLDVARAAEDAGIDRVVINDHVVMGRNTDAYSWGRFPVPPEAPWLEPMTVLAAMSAATTTVRLSTSVLVAPLRPAALLAKTVATLDVLSNGRVDLGVGVGWQREEYDAIGLSFADRGQLLTDTIGACRALWEQLPASYASATTTFSDVFCAPQPVQPRLPVWFGGTLNARNLHRVTELGDGWIAIMGATLDDLRAGAAALRAAAPQRSFTVQAPAVIARDDDKRPVIGPTMESVPALLDAGVTDVYVNLAAFCRDLDDAPAVLTELAARFGATLG